MPYDPTTDDIEYSPLEVGFMTLERPAIAVWDSKLFIVGASRLHSTELSLLQIDSSWTSFKYNNLTDDERLPEYDMAHIDFSQYESSLYILTYESTLSINGEKLLKIPRKVFSQNLINHLNGNKKVRGSVNKTWDRFMEISIIMLQRRMNLFVDFLHGD